HCLAADHACFTDHSNLHYSGSAVLMNCRHAHQARRLLRTASILFDCSWPYDSASVASYSMESLSSNAMASGAERWDMCLAVRPAQATPLQQEWPLPTARNCSRRSG